MINQCPSFGQAPTQASAIVKLGYVGKQVVQLFGLSASMPRAFERIKLRPSFCSPSGVRCEMVVDLPPYADAYTLVYFEQEPANVAVTKDGTVEVQLDSNPTTGYTW